MPPTNVTFSQGNARANLFRGILVKVGSVAHPMEKEHYIEWIELIIDGKNVCRKYLQPGDAPEAAFPADAKGALVREYCSLHGLWKA